MSHSTIGAPVRPQPHNGDHWIAGHTCLDIDLDDDESIEKYIEMLENHDLWHQTCIQMITARKIDSPLLGKSALRSALLVFASLMEPQMYKAHSYMTATR